MKNIGKTGILIAAMALTFAGCQKTLNTAKLTVKMTDAPAFYDEVNVDVRQVMVHYGPDTASGGGWVSLTTNAGIYDLLSLQNNVLATITADSLLKPGTINQFRLVLGDSNYTVKDSVVNYLKVPSGSETGLKINLNQTLKAGATYEMILDFDAARSIVVTGTGGLILKPVIKLKAFNEL